MNCSFRMTALRLLYFTRSSADSTLPSPAIWRDPPLSGARMDSPCPAQAFEKRRTTKSVINDVLFCMESNRVNSSIPQEYRNIFSRNCNTFLGQHVNDADPYESVRAIRNGRKAFQTAERNKISKVWSTEGFLGTTKIKAHPQIQQILNVVLATPTTEHLDSLTGSSTDLSVPVRRSTATT